MFFLIFVQWRKIAVVKSFWLMVLAFAVFGCSPKDSAAPEEQRSYESESARLRGVERAKIEAEIREKEAALATGKKDMEEARRIAATNNLQNFEATLKVSEDMVRYMEDDLGRLKARLAALE